MKAVPIYIFHLFPFLGVSASRASPLPAVLAFQAHSSFGATPQSLPTRPRTGLRPPSMQVTPLQAFRTLAT